jgi:hypothetical protein
MRSMPKEQNRQERRILGRIGMSTNQAMHRIDRALVMADDPPEALAGD